jgi:hypothetical protein
MLATPDEARKILHLKGCGPGQRPGARQLHPRRLPNRERTRCEDAVATYAQYAQYGLWNDLDALFAADATFTLDGLVMPAQTAKGPLAIAVPGFVRVRTLALCLGAEQCRSRIKGGNSVNRQGFDTSYYLAAAGSRLTVVRVRPAERDQRGVQLARGMARRWRRLSRHRKPPV